MRVWNGSAGTRIEVRHLFFNTPVRRKFMRTAATEMGHICEIFTRIALARPGIHLVLKHNGKNVYEVPATADLLERIGVFFGKEVRDKLYPLDATQGPAHLYGYIADPACDRGNAKTQYLFLNGRWIRDRSLGHALQEGYRGLLMTGRYAVAFLFLEVPADQVDVNVHPTKAEVRFRDAGTLYSMVLAAVRNRLNEEELTSRLQPPSPGNNGAGYFTPKPADYTPSLFAQPGFPAFTKNPASSVVRGTSSVAEPSQESGIRDQESEIGAIATDDGPRTTDHFPEEAESTEPTDTKPVLPEVLNAIQVHNTYLVVETSEGMLVIDQHALHERVLYEEIKERISPGHARRSANADPRAGGVSGRASRAVVGASPGIAGVGFGRRGFRRQHRYRNALSGPPWTPPARGDSQARCRSFDVEGAPADARATLERPDELDGLPRRRPLRRSADGRRDRRFGGDAPSLRRHAPLPARPTDGAVVHAARAGSAISADLSHLGFRKKGFQHRLVAVDGFWPEHFHMKADRRTNVAKRFGVGITLPHHDSL